MLQRLDLSWVDALQSPWLEIDVPRNCCFFPSFITQPVLVLKLVLISISSLVVFTRHENAAVLFVTVHHQVSFQSAHSLVTAINHHWPPRNKICQFELRIYSALLITCPMNGPLPLVGIEWVSLVEKCQRFPNDLFALSGVSKSTG